MRANPEPPPEPVATSLPVPLERPQIVSAPPLFEGAATPEVQRRVEKFYQALERHCHIALRNT